MHNPAERPHLAPGLRAVTRGHHHLQIGLYDDRRVLLPRTPSVERALRLLLGRTTGVDDPAVMAVLGHLDRHGCLTWARADDAPAAVAVLGGFDLPGVTDARQLLEAVGVPVVGAPAKAQAVVVLSAGELDRERLDPLVRDRTSHVVVRLVDGCAILGPFVVPGATACLRCIDAHQSVLDPDHVAVTARYARATGQPRPDGVPDLDPALASLATAWAVRDVVAHLDGREPSTWSRTLVLSAEPAKRSEQEWLRHPQCGCWWSADAHMSGTM
jgi:hypothetical protein